jgi:hypothetical protein
MARFVPMKVIALCFLATGCAATPAPMPAGPPPLPPPTDFHIAGTAEIHLTPQMVVETGLAATVKATLDASAQSEVISAEPMRSHYRGHMSLIITDGSGNQSLANIDITMNGDSAGSPTDGLGEAINRFLDAASLIARPLQSTSQPSR